jgi:hypothetical protein
VRPRRGSRISLRFGPVVTERMIVFRIRINSNKNRLEL